MSQEVNRPTTGIGAQVGTVVLVILIFALIGFVALSVVTGNDFGLGPNPQSADSPELAPPPVPLGTPNPLAMTTFKQTALGFSLQYPRSWRKAEQGLQVILSPAGGGLAPQNLQGPAIWFGIPVDGAADPADLLNRLQAEYFPAARLLQTGSQRVGGESWPAVQLQFETEALGQAQAVLAASSHDGVGYYVIAAAPTGEWNAILPQFNTIMSTFQFTTQAVLRPTDATPPPTPTPTPTPVFYIIQSGDTLSHVSVMYDVSIEAIMDRNGLTKNSVLHPGDKLIIPRKRQR